jgi:peptide/nickel transport system substrate-binding protein
MRGIWFLIAAFLLTLVSCRPDRRADQPEFEINARLAGEPDRLHPMLTSVGYATDILRLTHFALLDFHPLTLELEPLLAAEMPEVMPVDTGRWAGGQAFRYRIRPEARWDDGSPVTAADYIFTLKAAFHPLVKANAWRGFLSMITDVQVDPSDPRRFTVFTADDYFLALPVTGNFNIYPRHVYDPQGLMDAFSLQDLRDPARADSLAAADERMMAFAEQFTSDAWSRDTALVQGAGPYRLESWTGGENLVLARKADWWGDALQEEGAQFTARPARIRFKFIPDEQAALSLLRDGGLDVLAGVSPSTFSQLTADTAASRDIATVLPVFMQYVFIALNNRNPKLEDARTRRALAHLLDMDEVLRTVLLGLGERITGPFHPSKPYYNHQLPPLAFDPAKARQLLNEAGWADSNNNGILDRTINGKRVELELTLLLPAGSEVGPQLGLILQQGARQAGVAVRVETRDFKLITEQMARRDYDMSLLRLRQSPADDDPYQSWHSDSDRPDGSNRYSYRSAAADSLIGAIRQERDQVRRYTLYRELHRRIYEDQPVLFLYAPREPVLARKAVQGLEPSPMRPGYYLPFLYL